MLFAPRDVPPLGPDAAGDVPRYRQWVADRRSDQRRTVEPRPQAPDAAPTVTFLVVASSSEWRALWTTLGTLRAQTSSAWSAAVGLVQGPGQGPMTRLARAGAATRWRSWRTGPRWQWRAFSPGTTSADVLRSLFDAARTDAVALLEPGDELERDAVSLLSAALRTVDLVYADEDEIDRSGGLWRPRLKPGWSPELLLSAPYLGRPMAVRTDLVRASGAFGPESIDDPEHDLMLRVTERTGAIAHLPEVLCHRPSVEGPPERRPGGRDVSGPGSPPVDGRAAVGRTVERRTVVGAALARRGENADVEPGPLPRTSRVRRTPPAGTTVSVIVPFRDQPQFLRACVDSLFATASERIDLQLLLVDNGSTDPETLSLVERLHRRHEVEVVHDPRPFNWAAINNAAAQLASAQVLVFLNNDIEALHPGWLDALVAQALRPDVGVVGARLLYPDRRVQHVGMVVGLGGAAGHVLVGLGPDEPGYLGQAVLARECSAVTGACLATRRSVFEALGGFDEELGLDLNDVDYCLRAGQRDLRVLVEPAAELIHHESPSRGTSGSADNIRRFVERWETLLLEGDPYLNPNLTRVNGSCALRGPDEQGWWLRWRSTLPSW